MKEKKVRLSISGRLYTAVLALSVFIIFVTGVMRTRFLNNRWQACHDMVFELSIVHDGAFMSLRPSSIVQIHFLARNDLPRS